MSDRLDFLEPLTANFTEADALPVMADSLAPCHDLASLDRAQELSVADLWKRIRDTVFADQEEGPA